METKELLERIEELRAMVSKYNTESFVGYFADFLRNERPNPAGNDLNKFGSRLTDSFYLIGLNIFSSNLGTEKFEFDPLLISRLAKKIEEIKRHYRIKKLNEYSKDAMIHEMAFRNHFDNGVLSFVEQDLERIRSTFLPFNQVIEQYFGFDVELAIDIYKTTELITKIRFEQITEFAKRDSYTSFLEAVNKSSISFENALKMLSEQDQNSLLSFANKPYSYLVFSKEDLYFAFPKEKVDCFLSTFSTALKSNKNFQYYTDSNPLELAPILEIGQNKYLHVCQKQLPIAIYKRFYSYLLLDTSNDKVRRHREKSLEKKVIEIFKAFFPKNAAFFYENYYVEENAEQDLLILYSGFALVVEIKASKLREPFRDLPKAITRLKSDFAECIQYGYDQCQRVENLFFEGRPFRIRNVNGNVLYQLNPAKYHRIYSIVVTLERFGSLQTDLSLLLEKNPVGEYPWSVYINDLEIFLLSLKQLKRNPVSQLFQFLKSRTLLHGHVYAIDELDICANYINNERKFMRYAKDEEILVQFSPYEQSLFDSIYHAGRLHFKEDVTEFFIQDRIRISQK